MNTPPTAGAAIVDEILRQGTPLVFCVPGESYLAILDALHDAGERTRVISCRHESGAAMMALASARLTGRAGLVLVTRGPGATNASIALHIARQGSIPLVVGIGQVARENLGREAFQEIDYEAFLGPLCKQVIKVSDAADAPLAMRRAYELAEAGRPGPVALALPEDMLRDPAVLPSGEPLRRAPRAPTPDEVAMVQRALAAAKRPLIVAGGSTWSDADCAELVQLAEHNDIPVVTAFRRHDVFDNTHHCYGGYLGYSTPDAVWPLVDAADCVLVLGARLDEPTTRDYSILLDKAPRELLHVYPSPDEIGANYGADLALVADPGAVAASLAAAGRIVSADTGDWLGQWRAVHAEGSAAINNSATAGTGPDPARFMAALNARLDDTAIVTIDAGNFTRWPMRCRAYRRPGRMLGPVNGAMGFGVPAAVGAALTCPGQQVVGCVGDGGMLMTGNELATAMHYDARPLIVVFNNNRYGTIEMHQDRDYPGRRIATTLTNPDFADYAASFGLFAARVAADSDIEGALDAALNDGRAALLELPVDGY